MVYRNTMLPYTCNPVYDCIRNRTVIIEIKIDAIIPAFGMVLRTEYHRMFNARFDVLIDMPYQVYHNLPGSARGQSTERLGKMPVQLWQSERHTYS